MGKYLERAAGKGSPGTAISRQGVGKMEAPMARILTRPRTTWRCELACRKATASAPVGNKLSRTESLYEELCPVLWAGAEREEGDRPAACWMQV